MSKVKTTGAIESGSGAAVLAAAIYAQRAMGTRFGDAA
jgi:hypothetical protein